MNEKRRVLLGVFLLLLSLGAWVAAFEFVQLWLVAVAVALELASYRCFTRQ